MSTQSPKNIKLAHLKKSIHLLESAEKKENEVLRIKIAVDEQNHAAALEDKYKEIRIMKNETDNLRIQNGELQDTIHEMQDTIDRKNTQIKQLSKEKERLENAMKQLEKEAYAADEQNKTLKNELDLVKEQLRNTQEELGQVQNELREVKAQNQRYTSEIHDIKQYMQGVDKTLKKLEKKQDETQKSVDRGNATILSAITAQSTYRSEKQTAGCSMQIKDSNNVQINMEPINIQRNVKKKTGKKAPTYITPKLFNGYHAMNSNTTNQNVGYIPKIDKKMNH